MLLAEISTLTGKCYVVSLPKVDLPLLVRCKSPHWVIPFPLDLVHAQEVKFGRYRFSTLTVGAVAFVTVAALLVGAPTAHSDDASSAPAAGLATTPIALVYRGPVSCPGCAEAAAQLVRDSGLGFRVRFVGPGENLKLVRSSFADAALYVQPGGDVPVSRAPRLLGAAGVAAIREFVLGGGHYLGICQGAYLAGSPGLGLISPGDSGQYITSKRATVRTDGDTIVNVRWRGRSRKMFFQDGPYLIPPGRPGDQVLARYPNGLVAALVTDSGSGRVGLVGPHPEARRDWYSQRLRRADTDGLDAALGRDLLRTTLGG